MFDLVSLRDTLEFGNPQALRFVPMAAACLLLCAVTYVVRRRQRPRRTHGSSYPLIGHVRLWLAATGILAVVGLAAAQPRFMYGGSGFRRGTVDLPIVIDVSASMWVRDLGPSRLEVAIREVLNLQAEGILQTGDRAGLFVFGGTAIRKVHLSSNVERLMETVRKLEPPETLTGDWFPWDSDVATAFEHVYQSLDLQDRFEARENEGEWRPARRTDRAVIFLTDGDFEVSREQVRRLDSAFAEFRRRGLAIHPIGIGTRTGAELITVLREYQRDRDYDSALSEELDGQRTQMNMTTLAHLAQQTGGTAFAIDNIGHSASGFLREAVGAHRGVTFQLIRNQGTREAWQYLVACGILLFALAVLFY